MSNSRFQALEGTRGLFSLWVVVCHVAEFFLFFFYIAYYNHYQPELINEQAIVILNNAYWSKLMIGQGLQVDVFFIISSFLIFYRLIDQVLNATATNKSRTQHRNPQGLASAFYESCLQTIQRLFRLWPMLFAAVMFTILIGDLNSQDPRTLLSVFFLPINEHVPITFMVCWSTLMDLLNNMVLLFVVKVWISKAITTTNFPMTKEQKVKFLKNGMFGSVVLLLIVLTLRITLHYSQYPDGLNYLQLRNNQDLRPTFLPLFLPKVKTDYYFNELFPAFLSSAEVNASSTAAKNINAVVSPVQFRHPGYGSDYLAMVLNELLITNRLPPFIFGLMLAIQYYLTLLTDYSKFKKIYHCIYLSLSAYFVGQLLSSGLDPSEQIISLQGYHHQHYRQPQENNLFCPREDSPYSLSISSCSDSMFNTNNNDFTNFWAELYASIFFRCFYGMSIAYLLYRVLLPKDHPLHVKLMAEVFQWQGFQLLGKYSYGVYLLHTRIILQLMMKVLPIYSFYSQSLKLLPSFCSIALTLFLIGIVYCGVTMILTFIVAIAATEFVETPLRRVMKGILLSSNRAHNN